MKNKLIYYSAWVGVLGLIGGFFYFKYQITDTCRMWESVSSDKELNDILRLELSNYFSNPQVRSSLEGKAGVVFRSDAFNPPFVSSLRDKSIIDSRIKLLIKIDREDKRFIEPYNILEVGIGYARSSLMFKSEKSSKDNVLKLQPASYVDCKVLSSG